MSFRNALVTQLLNDKKYTALQEYLQIEFPGKDTVMIQEYAGEVPRVFYNMDDNIMLMLPGSMNTYMENAVANAIQSGTIFDDAENVKNTAEYIRMTTLPYGGMALKGHDEPKALKSTIGSVVGAMNVDTAHFGDGENDLQNGYTAMKDMMSHANDSDMATTKLIKDYIKLKDDGKLPIEYRRTLGKVKYDVKNLEDVTCDDCITKSDYRPMKLTDECGSVCAVDEFDDTNASTEEIADDAKSVVKDQTDIIDEEDDVVDSSEFEGGGKEDVSFDESFYNTSNNHDEIYSESLFNKRPKKLKPIPRDIVAYITVEMNNIQDSNDQAMLAGYTCSKLELVDFYLNCIDTEDDRYIVPHTRQYLVQMQNDLNRLLTQILRIKPVNKMDRIWKIGVNLPG